MFTRMLRIDVRSLFVKWRICLLYLAGFNPILGQAQLIDQVHNKPDTAIAAFSAGGLAQSFKQRAASVAGAGAYVFGSDGFAATVEIALWDGLPNAAGRQLASASAATQADGWVDVFWAPVQVVSGNTYYLVFSGGRGRVLAGDESNGYPDGQVFANNYDAFPSLDFAFRTYAAAVPEPATWLLSLLGLATIGVARLNPRRRSR